MWLRLYRGENRGGALDAFSPWEVLDRARRRDVAQVLPPRVCSPEGAFWEGVGPCVLATD
jgi:hypothetical protein